MKICIFHNTGPGGAQRMVVDVAVRLAKTDEVWCVTWNDDPDPPMPGVTQVHMPVGRPHLREPLHPFGDLTRSWIGSVRAAHWVDDHDFDVVFAHACRWAQAPEGLRRLRTPVLYFAQEGRRRSSEAEFSNRTELSGNAIHRLGSGLFDAVGGWMDRRAMAGPVRLATNSAHTARRLSDAYGVDAEPVRLGVDDDVFRARDGVSPGHTLLTVGAFEPMKRPMWTIEAAARVPTDDRPQVRLVANRGSPAYRAQLLGRARFLGVDLKIMEGLDDEELADEYRRARLVIAPASNEPFGLTVPEASACGTPVIAVASGGFVESVFPEVNGLLVDDNIDALTDGIIAGLATRPALDPQSLSAWAHDRWSWNSCTAHIRRLLVETAESG